MTPAALAGQKKKGIISAMSERNTSSSNGLANIVTLLGVALVVAAGVTAYPSVRGWLGLDVSPQGFGDETALRASIVESSESLPQNGGGVQPGVDSSGEPASSSAEPPPLVLPETPLQSEVTPAPDTSATPSTPPRAGFSASATAPPADPTPPPTEPAPVSTPEDTPQAETEFTPDAPSRLVIPSIDLDAPVLSVGWSIVTQNNGQQVSMWDVPNRYAAGWLKTSAQIGERGNTVLDGHHNIAGEVFRDLVDLKQGDTIQVWAGDQLHEYVVSLLKILPEKGQPIPARLENARWIQPTQDERLTLVTCWPYENNTHRLIVVAVPADALPSPAEELSE